MPRYGIDRESSDWYLVRNLFAAHLHEDYDAAHGDAWGAVRDFAAASTTTELGYAAQELRRLLAMFDDEVGLADAAEWIGMAYYPPADGYTYHGWLEEVADFLASKR